MEPHADVLVTPLRLGRVELPEFHPGAPGFDVIQAFLVEDGAHHVLVDTGVGTGSTLIDRLYRPERVELSDALGKAGTSLGGVTAVVSSHLHFDHCGGNALFPGVPIYVQRAELEATHRAHYTIEEWVHFPGARYVPLDGAHTLSPHLALLPTPGHTPGHQSLVVRSENDVQVVAAQAAYSSAEFQTFLEVGASGPGFQPHLEANATWSAEAYVASLDALRRLRPRRAFFSHDPNPWEREI